MPSPDTETGTTRILLLKTKSVPHDGYDEYFTTTTTTTTTPAPTTTATTTTPTFIPVLSHNFHTPNLQTVRDLFTSNNGFLGPPENRKYGGLIFTSQRAVEGFADVVGGVVDEKIKREFALPLYTVGPATHRSLSTLTTKHLPHATIHGQETGNGGALAEFILQHYNGLYSDTITTTTAPTPNTTDPDANTQPETQAQKALKPPLLFLVGEQRRDIIPKTLTNPSLPPHTRIGVDELVVYETGVMEGFEESFSQIIATEREIMRDSAPEKQNEGRVVWVVVFSPTGCEGMVGVLRENNYMDGEDGGRRRRFFVATIGPTTRDHLRNEFGFEADVCAERPSPEGVGEGIRRFMEGRG
ncbi:tetrapyrrole biosynthesis, uroporphyrinogen III synthase [Aspergillus heteromorphus CBS 117.55]|uniref:Tetrapyrrole biosynthesis, uroporphyrinogen III synthase n=1 Tax=Aspergillus heteromorphus CBS 117.55 TaxID=1448321 RepID=A0A317WRS4_9EURO|nr:tetrapyrrole biosynthesis, uroporphyrinogen III synthase [Aspergillus heteromorphus CBS 117.55]PWY88431.1 tetrapyrrole biosynthesis, uroporphyrinogen III synthase [Aspergillus heteromorphus CBS 117.55]